MLKYNPFNEELANAIDGLKQQIAQLRNDIEFLSASAQRADDRFGGGGGPVVSHVAVPVRLGSVDEKEASGSIQGFGFGPEYEWMQGITSQIKAVNVLNADGGGGGTVFHNLSLESDVAEIAIADPSTSSGAIFHFVLAPSDVYEGGFAIDPLFCNVYTVTRNLDDDSVSWSEENDEEGFVPPDGQRQNGGEYQIPPVRLNGDDEEKNEEQWKVQVFTYCKPDITVECLDDVEEEPDP